jgi:hypothetical protein
MMAQINELEHKALSVGLDSECEWIAALRSQIPFLEVTSRSFNSAGGFTNFKISGNPVRAHIPDGDLNYPPTVLVRHNKLIHGGAIIIWVSEGVIDCIEAVSDGDGEWPINAAINEFEFSKPE